MFLYLFIINHFPLHTSKIPYFASKIPWKLILKNVFTLIMLILLSIFTIVHKDNLEFFSWQARGWNTSRFYFRIFIDIIFGDRADDRKVSRTGFKAMQVFFEQRAETHGRRHTRNCHESRVHPRSVTSLFLLIHASRWTHWRGPRDLDKRISPRLCL